MRPIITVEGLSKRYHIGSPPVDMTLRERLTEAARSPLRRFKRDARPEADTLWALKDVSFEVMHGEVVGILGRNGAGKSTLLKILSRVIEPTAGRVQLYGRVGSLLEVGTGFHPELTGRENIFLNGSILGMGRREIEAKFDNIVSFAEVERFINMPVKHYSSGMYVRLAFSVAVHLEPEILIVDEVLSVGDLSFQEKCLNKIRSLVREGRTVFFVSHNLKSITEICTRAILLDAGQKQRDGLPSVVVNEYSDAVAEHKPEIKEGDCIWRDPTTAPGTGRMRLRSVRLLDESGQVRAAFGMDEEITVELTYWILQPDLETNVGYHLHNSKGVFVFVSQDFHDAEWLDRPKEAGCYRSVCRIPGKFLNQGTYILDAAVFMAFSPRPDVFERQVLKFEVVDEGPSEVRSRFEGEWTVGVLRPKLPWMTERVKGASAWG
jgi:lipopolysaccharide transport system ATP-binding protein